MTLFFLAVIILIVLSAIFAPWLAPMDPEKSSMANRLRPIGYKKYLLGTDEQGRDMLSRLLWGGRISLLMGILPVIFATTDRRRLRRGRRLLRRQGQHGDHAHHGHLLRLPLGAARRRHRRQPRRRHLQSDAHPHRRADSADLPRRRNRHQRRSASLDFVDAARASGASTISILFTHVLINVLSPVLVYSSTLVSISIILASGLSFLGLGVSPPTADWGLMLSTLRQAIYVQPLVTALPGIAILITSIAFNLVSDGLRQAMDVKSCRPGEHSDD